MVEKIYNDNEYLGIIIRDNISDDGISFFTENNDPMQLAFMKHQQGKDILPHTHNTVKREIFTTSEVLIIKKGRLRVDFYSHKMEYLESRVISKGDIILLAGGGHGFHVLEDVEFIEVKQGPYLGDNDKVRFAPVNSNNLKLY